MINKVRMIAISGLTSLILVASVVGSVFAQTNSFQNLEESVTGFGRVVSAASIVIFSFAFLVFFWNLVKYIMAGDGSEKKNNVTGMIWSIVVLFVMVSIWGIVNFLGQAVGVDPDTDAPGNVTIPRLDFK